MCTCVCVCEHVRVCRQYRCLFHNWYKVGLIRELLDINTKHSFFSFSISPSDLVYLSLSLSVSVCLSVHIYIYIYIYREREREIQTDRHILRERERD